jgi:hypothetical protein
MNETCVHCGEPIKPNPNDPATPTGWIHRYSGNSFCDVHSPTDAVLNVSRPNRTEAVPA